MIAAALPIVTHDVMLQFVADGECDLVRCLGRRQVVCRTMRLVGPRPVTLVLLPPTKTGM